MKWRLKAFPDLTLDDLYTLLRCRSQVFVLEQECVYLDIDDKDQASYHLWGIIDGQLAAYARLLPAGVSYEQASIGRIMTTGTFRGYGIGKLLVAKAIEETNRLFGTGEIMIGAQHHLKHFYERFGFEQISEPYLEDGISHIKMLLKK